MQHTDTTNLWILCYEGEGKGGEGEGNKPKSFTQDDVNKFVAAERRSQEQKIAAMSTELDKLKEKSQLTDQERTDLEGRLKTIQDTSKTELEKVQGQLADSEKKHKKVAEQLSFERDTWRSRYTDATIARELTDAAATADAFNPSQVVSLLRPHAEIIEELDDSAKPKGSFAVKVTIDTLDKDKKPIKLKVSPSDAVKSMKDVPEKFGNLFKSGVKPGTGAGNKGGPTGVDTSSVAGYRASRSQLGLK